MLDGWDQRPTGRSAEWKGSHPGYTGQRQAELQTSATNVLTGPAENRILLLGADAQTARALQEALATRWIVEIGDASAAITAASPFAAALVADSGLLQAHDWWLLGWLRRNPATADTLIIALTAAGAPDTAALCLSAGADDCVAYPVSARELEARVVAKLGLTREREDPLRAVQALRQRLADAEAVNQAKDWLVTTLGHELRSPLSTISSALELMRVVGNDGGNQAVIERQVRHMIRLVEDLTDVTRIKGGNMTLSKERVELGSVVQSAVELVSPLLQERLQEFEIHVPPGLCAMMDASKMRQVMSNLLDNAAKYSEAGSPIAVFGERRAGMLRCTVVDQGKGIDPAMLERVFEMFSRQRDADRWNAGGWGIGLAIVRSIVELHGGSVCARSPGPGKGSEFVIEIPGCE